MKLGEREIFPEKWTEMTLVELDLQKGIILNRMDNPVGVPMNIWYAMLNRIDEIMEDKRTSREIY